MKQTAIVVAPGRGTYNGTELGYLARYHSDKSEMIEKYDEFRMRAGQPTLTELDSAEKFSIRDHTRGDNASALIHACAYLDFLCIDRDRFDVLGVTGNSMGWYIALTCAGAVGSLDGFGLVNTMGTLMQQALIGGQIVYPFVDDEWRTDNDQRSTIFEKLNEIDARPEHDLTLSIELGGMIVIGGNDAGLAAFEAEMPKQEDRFPLRLPNHAAFHTRLQTSVAAKGRVKLAASLFRQPELALIDGRGGCWYPHSCDLPGLWSYTLDHQVTEPYDFSCAIQTAAREFMPDVFIVLGPGSTLGGATAQSLVHAGWRGWNSKSDFKAAQDKVPRLISMGLENQRQLVTRST